MAWESLNFSVLDYVGMAVLGLVLLAPTIAALIWLGRLDEGLLGFRGATRRRAKPLFGSAIRTALQGVVEHRRD
jgi:hypothetical protein